MIRCKVTAEFITAIKHCTPTPGTCCSRPYRTFKTHSWGLSTDIHALISVLYRHNFRLPSLSCRGPAFSSPAFSTLWLYPKLGPPFSGPAFSTFWPYPKFVPAFFSPAFSDYCSFLVLFFPVPHFQSTRFVKPVLVYCCPVIISALQWYFTSYIYMYDLFLIFYFYADVSIIFKFRFC